MVLCQQMGIDPRRDFPNLRAVDATTQAYTLDWAREMEEFWGVPVVEMFGASQSIPGIMFCCEGGVQQGGRRKMLHALEHRLLFEVIDPQTGRHVRSGEEGELVVTTLTRTATPLIRFRMGDKVVYQAHTECACGRPFAGIQAGTVARYDDMIKIKGQNVWPEAVDAAVFSFREVEEYKATVFIDAEGRETVVVQYEVRPTAPLGQEDRGALPAKLQARVRERVGVSMQFVEVGRETLPRYEFKTRRWSDQRKAGRQVEHYLAH
jgi:phenylacetate-CoA ligase